MQHRAGFVAVVGRPNVGKSTLVNKIVGRKVSIVTDKPQTTRHRILAVHNLPAVQIIFVDTPGLHRRAGKAMNRLMNRTAANALADADLVLFLTDAQRFTDEDSDVLQRLQSIATAKVALLNKIDRVRPKERLLELIAAMSERADFAEIVPISAMKGDNLDTLIELIPAYLPESPPLFPADMRSDRSAEFQAAEIVREKLMLYLHQEVPYGLTVQIERYEDGDEQLLIDAIIWVERDSQKGIVVGKGGKVLKTVGQSARLELSQLLERRVHLELWVKVKDNWSDSEQDLQALGYESP
ncbi:MAG: GTPase Era [Gammaproteobacteria bacterium]|nr:GTPase Era [Gammaproteobacteria bacterium]